MRYSPIIAALLAALASASAAPPTEQLGVASFYSESHRGKLTANGEKFNPDKLTAATWFFPFKTRLRVTNLANGKSVIVRVNDRGPAKRLVRQGRVIDLSRAAFSKIANLTDGLVHVRIEKL